MEDLVVKPLVDRLFK